MNAEEFLEFEKKRRRFAPTLDKLTVTEDNLLVAEGALQAARIAHEEAVAERDAMLCDFYDQYNENEGIVNESLEEVLSNLEEGLQPDVTEEIVAEDAPINFYKAGSLSVNDLIDGERSLVQSAQEGLTDH